MKNYLRNAVLAVVCLALIFSAPFASIAAEAEVAKGNPPIEVSGTIVDGAPVLDFSIGLEVKDVEVDLTVFEPGSKAAVHTDKLSLPRRTTRIDTLKTDVRYVFFLSYMAGKKQVKSVNGTLILNSVTQSNGEKGVVAGFSVDSVIEADRMATLGTSFESEPNDSTATADWASNGSIMMGTINVSTDRDYFKITSPGTGNLTLILSGIPAGCDYDLYLYNASGTPLIGSTNGGTANEYISYPVTAGNLYYFQVYSYQGYSSTSYSLAVNAPTQTYMWYSQSWAEGTSQNWNRTNLTNLYFPNMAYCSSCGSTSLMKCRNTPLCTPNGFQPASNQLIRGHMNWWGCFVTSYAMVLRNLNATTTTPRSDFRTSSTSNLIADPFTVTMASLGWPSVTPQNGRYEILSHTVETSPVNASHSAIVSSFGRSSETVSFANYTTPEARASALTQLIAQNPEGILVRFSGHTMVFTGSTYGGSASLTSSGEAAEIRGVLITPENEEELLEDESYDCGEALAGGAGLMNTNYDINFTVYDPAVATASSCNGVPLSSCYSYPTYGGIDNILYVIVIR